MVGRRSFPFGALNGLFSGAKLLLVLGMVLMGNWDDFIPISGVMGPTFWPSKALTLRPNSAPSAFRSVMLKTSKKRTPNRTPRETRWMVWFLLFCFLFFLAILIVKNYYHKSSSMFYQIVDTVDAPCLINKQTKNKKPTNIPSKHLIPSGFVVIPKPP